MRPRLLDLFCGAGGCSVGYHRAGFDVVGVDIAPMPGYPFMEIYQGDALEFLDDRAFLAQFDVIHASPPCQVFTSAQPIRGREHTDRLAPTRDALKGWGGTYVIENVVGAPMLDPVLLCGSMFGLGLVDGSAILKRHRLFESNLAIESPAEPCSCVGRKVVGVYGHTGHKATPGRSGNHGWLVDDWKQVMDIGWMGRDELAQAIPPAYTEFIGRQLIEYVRNAPTPDESRQTPTRSAPLLAPERHAKGRPVHGRPVAESSADSASRGPGDVVLGGQDPFAVGEKELEQLAVAGVVADVVGGGECLPVVVECDGVAGAVGGEGSCCPRHVSSMAGVDTPCQYTRRDSLPESARAGP